MTSERALLEVDGVGVSFGDQVVLRTAAFAARRGQITTLMGRNGVGKTTLLRVAVGQVRPTWGRVLFAGEYLPRPSLADLARRGLMFSSQESALTGLFSIGDHVAAFCQVYKPQDLLPDVLARMKLGPLLGLRPHQLSGGEQQRVTLALAMLRRPTCLLMDEPFAGVAPLERPLIAQGLLSLKEQGVAIVISGHDVDDLFAVSDEIIWVTGGTTHWLGSPAQAAQHHEFRKIYLGPRWWTAPREA